MKEFRGTIGSKIEMMPNLRFKISGEFLYKEDIKTPCYDKQGNYLFDHVETKFTNKHNQEGYIDELFNNCVDTVFQKDFEFHNIKTFWFSRKEDLEKYNWSSIKAKVDYIPEDREHNTYLGVKYAEAVEMSLCGTMSYSVFRSLGKKIFDFNYKKYTENKNTFIKNNPHLKDECQVIYDKNLKMIADYFMCNTKKLSSKSFNMREQLIKRIMLKINIAENSKTKTK